MNSGEGAPAEDGPTTDEVLAAVLHTLDNAAFKLGRLKTRNRGTPLAKDVTSVAYDVSTARHDIARLRDELAANGPD